MKKSTIKFLIKLLDNEIQNEINMQNKNPLEVDYVKELISSSKDFYECYGEWYDLYTLNENLKELIK